MNCLFCDVEITGSQIHEENCESQYLRGAKKHWSMLYKQLTLFDPGSYDVLGWSGQRSKC